MEIWDCRNDTPNGIGCGSNLTFESPYSLFPGKKEAYSHTKETLIDTQRDLFTTKETLLWLFIVAISYLRVLILFSRKKETYSYTKETQYTLQRDLFRTKEILLWSFIVLIWLLRVLKLFCEKKENDSYTKETQLHSKETYSQRKDSPNPNCCRWEMATGQFPLWIGLFWV